MTITKAIEFDYGHRLWKHDGPCKNIHGHRGRVEVTLVGTVDPKTGMLIDFGRVKMTLVERIKDVLDHVFVIASDDPLADLLAPDGKMITTNGFGFMHTSSTFGRVLQLERGQPTVEILCIRAYHVLAESLNSGSIHVETVRFYETMDSYAEVSR